MDIYEGIPEPKTLKEWCVATICGINFEPPTRAVPIIDITGVLIDYDDDGTTRKLLSLDGETVYNFLEAQEEEDFEILPGTMGVDIAINGISIDPEVFMNVALPIHPDEEDPEKTIMALDFTQVEIDGVDLSGEIQIEYKLIVADLNPKTPIEKYLVDYLLNQTIGPIG